MHTSANEYADAVWRRAEQCHSVPSPLVGEGQGEGWRQTPSARLVSSTDSQRWPAAFIGSQHGTDAVRVVPLSLSLPHKGGGNRGVRTFATQAMCPRMDFQRCVHVLAQAGTQGPSILI